MAYHEPTVMWLFMIGHSLGRMEACFGPSTQGAGSDIKTDLKLRFCLQAIFEKKRGAVLEFENQYGIEYEIDGPGRQGILGLYI